MNLRCITGRNQANFFHPCKCTGNLPSRQSLFSVWDFCLALLFWGVELRKREEWPGLFSSICPFLAPPTVRVPSAEQTPLGAVQWAVSPPSSEHIPADAEACRNSQDTRGVFPGFQVTFVYAATPDRAASTCVHWAPARLTSSTAQERLFVSKLALGGGMSRLLVSICVSLQHNENGMCWERRA